MSADPAAGGGLTATVTAAFDQAADRYDSEGPQFAGPVAAGVVRAARLQPGWRVLDIGCGAGAVLLEAARAVLPGGHATGIDLAPRMLARARREAGLRGLAPHVSLREGDAAAPPFPPGSFDAVTASLVLYLLPDPAAALTRWRELLVPGGRLAFSSGVGPDPRWAGVFAAVEAFAQNATGFYGHVRRPGSLEDTRDRLAACGFRDIEATVETVTIRYDSPEQWWTASVSEGPWVTWQHIPPDRLPEAREAGLALAGQLREPDGTLLRHVKMAYVSAHRAHDG